MLSFMKDHVKIEAMDLDTSIITIQCPSSIAKELLQFIDVMIHVARWTDRRLRMNRASLAGRLSRVA